MSVAISEWYDEVLVNAPGASQESVEFAVERAVAEFLRRSGAWVEELPEVLLRAAKADYYLSAAGLGPILYTHAIYYEGKPLKPYTMSVAAPTGSSTAPTGWRGYLREPSRITIYPTLSVAPATGITPFVAIGYDPSCKERLPDIFFSHWYDVILSGTLFRLLSQQNKPYTDATLAVFHGKRFSSGIATARDMGRRQFMSTDTELVFPYWA